MAEAALAVGLTDGAAGLVIKCAQVIKTLHDVRGKYKTAELAFKMLIAQIETIKLAWTKIQIWSASYQCSNESTSDQLEILQELDRKLDCGCMVILALANYLDQVKAMNSTRHLSFRQRTKFIWNEATIEGHRSRIRDQVNTMTLLLQIISLPTPTQRNHLMLRVSQQLSKSDESAFSIVPSSWSLTSRHGLPSSASTVDLEYIPFDFEDDLFTARVYKRNYHRAKHRHSVQNVVTVKKDANTSMSAIQDWIEKTYDDDDNATITSVTQTDSDSIVNVSRSSAFHDVVSWRTSVQDRETHLRGVWTAVKNDQVDRLESCLLSGRCWDLKITSGPRSVLCDAVKRQNETIVDLLLCHGIDVYKIDDQGRTPIHEAAGRNSASIVQLLLDSGASVNDPDEKGHTPLHRACIENKVENVKILLEQGADVSKADPEQGFQPLHMAILSSSEFPLIEYLLLRGANPCARDSGGREPIHHAACLGRMDIMETLLDKGASISSKDFHGRIPLHYAANWKTSLPLTFLLQRCVDTFCCQDLLGIQPIHIAAHGNRPQVIGCLHMYGASLSSPTNAGLTPCHAAINNGAIESLNLILELSEGAEASATDVNGQAPMHYAAALDRVDIMRILVSHGACLTSRDNRGNSPFHHAITRNAVDALRFLDQSHPFHFNPVQQQELLFLAAKQNKYDARAYIEQEMMGCNLELHEPTGTPMRKPLPVPDDTISKYTAWEPLQESSFHSDSAKDTRRSRVYTCKTNLDLTTMMLESFNSRKDEITALRNDFRET